MVVADGVVIWLGSAREDLVRGTVRGSVPGHSDDLEIGVQIGCKLTSPCSQNFKHC